MAPHVRNRVSLSTGHRSMMPLNAPLACSPAESLQYSRDPKTSARRRVRSRSRVSYWHFATWNVRSLLDNEGSIETARLGPDCHQLAEDRRIDLVVRELGRYNITVGALQETKWFGNATYKVGKSVIVAAGRPTPLPGQSGQRGEGVAIVLTGPAIEAWKKGGQQWKSWGSRLVKVILITGSKESSKLHVLSCYAPTFTASREAKDGFYDDLQLALSEIPTREPYILLGDLNARVGSRDARDEEQWERVRGPFGMGEVNDAG